MTDLVNSIDMNLAFNEQTVRIIGTSDNPMFVVKDICNILGLTNVTETLRNIPDKWKYSVKLNTSTQGLQSTNVVNEAGLYKIIMRSNKPIAQPFQEFVCEEILPSIRKTGEYKYQKLLDEKNILKQEKDQLSLQLTYTDRKLNEKSEQLKVTSKGFRNLRKNHNSMLRKRVYHKFKKGPSFYIWNDPDCKVSKYKVGFSEDINQRLGQERTSVPELKMVYLIYVEQAKFIEQSILLKFRDYRVPLNHELVKIKSDTIINSVKNLLKYFKFEYTEEVELSKYNEIETEDNEELLDSDNSKVNLMFEDSGIITPPVKDIILKKCSKCQTELDLLSFVKSSKRGDGLDNNCKECNKKKYIESKHKEKNEIDIKKCNTCNLVKTIEDFYNRVGSSDGLTSQCQDCILNQYNKRKETREYSQVETKKCTECKEEQDIKDFGLKKDSVDGYLPKCKKCWNAYIINKNNTRKKVEMPTHKVCNECKINKSIDHYWNKKSSGDGKDNKCTQCHNAKRKS